MSKPAGSRSAALWRDAVAAYLAALYDGAPRGSLVELRYRTADGMGRSFHPAGDRDAIAAEILDRAPATDVYLGVIPRRRHGGGRDDLVPEAPVLWVDCDTPQAIAALTDHSPAPSIIVASGTAANAHAYWLLSRPEPLAAIEEGNRRLASALGADPACADAARILRAPASFNHKHRPPAIVRLLSCDPERRYLLADVAGDLTETVRLRRPRRVSLTQEDPLLGIPPAVYVERLTGEPVPRGGKIRCPFHEDRTPSLHVYEEPQRGWYCFGCGRGGSIYDFAAFLWRRETRGVAFAELHDELCLIFGPEGLVGP